MMSSLHPYATSSSMLSSNQLLQPNTSSLSSHHYMIPDPIFLSNSFEEQSVKKPITSSPFKKTFSLPPMFRKVSSRSDSTSNQLPTLPTPLKISSTSHPLHHHHHDHHRHSMLSSSSLLLRRSKDLLRRHHRSSRDMSTSVDEEVNEKSRLKSRMKVSDEVERSFQDLTITPSNQRNLNTSFLEIDEEFETNEEDGDEERRGSCKVLEFERSNRPSGSLNDSKNLTDPFITPSHTYSQVSPSQSSFSNSTIESNQSMFSNSLPVTPTTITSLGSTDHTQACTNFNQNPYMDSCIGLLASLNSLNKLSLEIPFEGRLILNQEVEQWNLRVQKCKMNFSIEEEEKEEKEEKEEEREEEKEKVFE
ncbi:hypothetical protein DFH28DRAFT_1083271 [Melampsora americana]|nr:hypothetical protein DFH28DRAFT_1083271 [Melampsora americana]